MIVEQLNINRKEAWYKEFEEIYNEIKENYELVKNKEIKLKDEIRKKNKKNFDEIDSNFAKKKGNIDFINYILKIKPYPGYEEDKKIMNKNLKKLPKN